MQSEAVMWLWQKGWNYGLEHETVSWYSEEQCANTDVCSVQISYCSCALIACPQHDLISQLMASSAQQKLHEIIYLLISFRGNMLNLMISIVPVDGWTFADTVMAYLGSISYFWLALEWLRHLGPGLLNPIKLKSMLVKWEFLTWLLIGRMPSLKIVIN